MQQLLAAHDIPSRVLTTGVGSYLGQGSWAVVQVRPQDQWTALLVLSQPEEELD